MIYTNTQGIYYIFSRSIRTIILRLYVALLLEIVKKHLPNAKIPCMEKDYLKVIHVPVTDKIKNLGYDDEFKKIMPKLVDKNWLKQNNNKCIVPIRSWSESWIGKFFNLKDAAFIYSMWEGYLEEKSFKKTTGFFQKKGIEKIDIHASGHAFKSALVKVINKIKPKLLIPIHTEHPGHFETLPE